MRAIALKLLVLAGVAMMSLSACSPSASLAEDREAVQSAVRTASGADALVDPIVLRRDYAIAGWTHGDVGGRSLLHREGKGWKVIASGGGELRDAESLAKAGVGEKEAKALANSVIAKERDVPEDRLTKFDHYVANAAPK